MSVNFVVKLKDAKHQDCIEMNLIEILRKEQDETIVGIIKENNETYKSEGINKILDLERRILQQKVRKCLAQ